MTAIRRVVALVIALSFLGVNCASGGAGMSPATEDATATVVTASSEEEWEISCSARDCAEWKAGPNLGVELTTAPTTTEVVISVALTLGYRSRSRDTMFVRMTYIPKTDEPQPGPLQFMKPSHFPLMLTRRATSSTLTWEATLPGEGRSYVFQPSLRLRDRGSDGRASVVGRRTTLSLMSAST